MEVLPVAERFCGTQERDYLVVAGQDGDGVGTDAPGGRAGLRAQMLDRPQPGRSGRGDISAQFSTQPQRRFDLLYSIET